MSEDRDKRDDVIESRSARARHLHRKGWIQLAIVAALIVATGAVRSTEPDPIRVVETGFSRITVPGEGDGISWAVIVENTSDRAAYGVDVRISFRLQSGRLDGTGLLPGIDALMPGQRVGLAGDSLSTTTDATGFEVDVEGPERWGSPEDAPTIVAREVEVGYSPENHPYVDFKAEADADEALEEVDAYALFRDEQGALIGGIWTLLLRIEPGEPTPDRSRAETPFPDLATVEVYVVPRPF